MKHARISLLTGAAIFALALLPAAFAQQDHSQHGAPAATAPKAETPKAVPGTAPMMGAAHGAAGGHDMADMKPKGGQGPASHAFAAINRQMHSAMDFPFSGNTDVDFVKGMIPHHAGAVDMAKVVLAFGKDPEIRKLAEAVIKAQETEIAMMQDWLSKNARYTNGYPPLPTWPSAHAD